MDQTTSTQPNLWTPRRVAIATLIVLSIFCAFWVLFNYRLVFFSLFVAVVLSTAIKPLIDRLTRLGIPSPVSIVVISLLILAILLVLILVFIPLIGDQWFTISRMISTTYQDLRQNLLNSQSLILQRIISRAPAVLPLAPPGQNTVPTTPAPATKPEINPPPNLVQQAFDVTGTIFRTFVMIMSVLLLTGLWIVEGDAATRFMIMGLPPARRDNVRDFLTDIETKIGGYTRGLALMLLIIGILAGIAYVIIGLPNALMLAIIAGVMEIVPLIGPALGAIPAILVAASTDPTKVIWVILAYTIIQLAESHFIVPRVMDRTVGVNPVASLLAFIAFGSLFGFLGAVLAVPLAAVLQLVLNRFVFDKSPAEITPVTGRNVISTLRYETQDLVMDVRKQIREKETEVTSREDRIEDAMEAIAVDLDSVLAEAEPNDPPSGKGKVA